MLRTVVMILALCAFLTAESSADEPPSALDLRVAAFGDLILTFKTWPLQGEVTEVLDRTLEAAGFRVTHPFSNFRSWLLRSHKWLGGPTCAELMLDERILTAVESCSVDMLICPPRPPSPG